MSMRTSIETLFSEVNSLADLIGVVDILEKKEYPNKINFGISSSVVVEQLGLFLKKYGFLSSTRLAVINGNYDDPVGDATLFIKNNVDYAIFLPFYDNILPSFETQLDSLSESLIDNKVNEIKVRYRLTLEKCKFMKSVFLGTFHRMSVIPVFSNADKSEVILNRLNKALLEEAKQFTNVSIINTEDVLKYLGHQNSFDERFYYRNKAPYKSAYLNEIARRIYIATRGFNTYFYKVLVLDCDNTLWGGIIGEDLLSGIKLDPYDYPGNIYWKIQNEILNLESNGILICLCSKNNIVDVDEVFAKHSYMVLKNKNILSKKINWDDKPSNIQSLALELNIGLDSMIFLDDSSFECEAVQQQLPMVKVMQVPKNISDYPKLFSEIKNLFLINDISSESRSKTDQYRQRSEVEQLKAAFNSQEEYLESLGIEVELSVNSRCNIPRISELSKKSNQFNLTTIRYGESQILSMMESDEYDAYSLAVSDKFGNSGLTGVVVIRYEANIAIVENFYMSCRVIGRGVEMVIWQKIIANSITQGCTQINATYIESSKNSLVSDFYDRLGFLMTSQLGNTKIYSTPLLNFLPPQTLWIVTHYAE